MTNESSEDRSALNRRDFIRRAAATTAAAVWAVPIVQTVAATPAYAQSQGSPPPTGGCFVKADPASGKGAGCIDTCHGAGCGYPDEVCGTICYGACNLPEAACPDEYCDASCWSCDETGHLPIFVC
jgi:hypothetical protein